MLKIAFDKLYVQPLPDGHRFPMLKYELIPGQLLHEGTISRENLFTPALCPDDIITLTHTREYVDKLHNQTLSAQEQRRIGFPQSPELTTRELMIAQGTIDIALYAIQYGVALNVAGGTHHAFADRGEGFCMLNDMAIATNYLLKEKIARKILIIDLDVHQGNGTAKIFNEVSEVFTFSMHGAHNFPFHKEKSNLDVPLAEGITDNEYLDILDDHLDLLLSSVKPDFVFYLSGVDVLSTDRYGKLNLTIEGCRNRDKRVFTALNQKGIPCAVAMGGGYSADIKIIVEAHCNTYREAKDVYKL